MNNLHIFVLQFFLIVCPLIELSAQSNAVNTTGSININADWTFSYSPSTKENNTFLSSDFKDGHWLAIALPHTWSTYETTNDKHPFIKNPSEQDDAYWWKGWGYYRKKIFFGKESAQKKIFLEFDGVQKYAKIYLNGEYIDDHKGGYNSFDIDLTDKIKWGQENTIAIVVSNRRDDAFQIPPMTAGNFNVYGGIYRDVRLVIKNKLFIPYQGSHKHEGGTFITTPSVTEKEGRVKIKTFVRNEYPEAQNCSLVSVIFSPSGKTVKTLSINQIIPSGQTYMFEQETEIQQPSLWSPDHPDLYKVVTTLLSSKKIVDEYESPLGFRWFHWDYATNNLYVNGKKINIRGINRHQEYPWLGDAIPKWLTRMDLVDIKVNLGHNFMRAAHYPNDPYFYHLADSLGIIMVEEVPNIKSIDFSEEVQEQNVREMIRRDRNHPSIFFWSMGNETSDAADSKWAVEEDTTRIIHLRKGAGGGNFVQHTDKNLDLENLLRVTPRGWFNEADAPKGFSSTPENGQFASNETWQWLMAMQEGGSARGVLGSNCSAWLYEDHGCDREYLNSPVKHVNAKGWVDIYREPKYIYYLTRALYTQTPVVYIHADTWRKQYVEQKKDIIVDSNCDEVELFVNGITRGKQFPSANAFPTVTFKDIAIAEGEIKATGRKNGKLYQHKVRMPGKPAKIVLETNQKVIVADRSGIAIIRANIMDMNDDPVFDASNPLSWKVSGVGQLVGLPVYETDIMKNEATEGSGYTIVPVSNVIRSTATAGIITVTVSSPGLKSASINISCIANKLTLPGYIKLPSLQDASREKVRRDTTYTEKIEFVEEIKSLPGNVLLKGNDINSYQQSLQDFIKQNNEDISIKSEAFKMFVKKMLPPLIRLKGELIADDYNFITQQYNQYRTLNKLIDSKSFHPIYASLLNEFYLDKLLRKNEIINVAEETKKIKDIPSKLTAVIIQSPDLTNQEGKIQKDNVLNTISVSASNAAAAVGFLYPGFSNLDSNKQEKILKYLDEINPHLTLNMGDKQFISDEELMKKSEDLFNHGHEKVGLKGVLFFMPEISFLEKQG